ncbi:MAG: hypothetical protein AAFN12_16505 [Cyanobacteria bacterium J06560_2]
MGNKLTDFRRWLFEKRSFRMDWFAKDPQLTPAPEEALSQLPDDTKEALLAAVNKLPIHPVEQSAILEALDEAIGQWKEQPHLANNSLVMLAHPVSSVARILTESLHQLRTQKESRLDVNLLDWVERPPKSNDIQKQLERKLGNAKGDSASGNSTPAPYEVSDKDSDKTPKNLAVIPNLSWCFLRSVEGLEGVDYLQETLLSDRTQFWIIGSGRVGWDYLKSTLKLHAYCGDTMNLPVLTGEQLQDWLAPIVDQFAIQFSDAAIHKRISGPGHLLNLELSVDHPIEAISEITQEVSATARSSIRAMKEEIFTDDKKEPKNSAQRDYFNRLADISDGVSVVALQLFIQSLRCRKKGTEEMEEALSAKLKGDGDSEEASEGTAKESSKDASEDKSEQPQLTATIPKLPTLPELSQSDLYLIYSLMLHGDLSIKALAESLGDAPQVVNNQVQMLRSADIIEQKNGIIKANPVHYPKLRRELSNNNFIIEVP